MKIFGRKGEDHRIVLFQVYDDTLSEPLNVLIVGLLIVFIPAIIITLFPDFFQQ